MQVKPELIVSIAGLARAAPAEWERFMAEYALYAQQSKDELVSASPDAFPSMQGQVRQIVFMGDLLVGAKQKAEKLRK